MFISSTLKLGDEEILLREDETVKVFTECLMNISPHTANVCAYKVDLLNWKKGILYQVIPSVKSKWTILVKNEVRQVQLVI